MNFGAKIQKWIFWTKIRTFRIVCLFISIFLVKKSTPKNSVKISIVDDGGAQRSDHPNF